MSPVAAAVLAATMALSPAPLPASQDAISLLRAARRSAREEGDDSFLRSLGSRSALWGARVSLARAAAGDRSSPPVGPSLGLAGIDEWLALRNDPKVDAFALAAFASRLPPGPIAIEAAGEASVRLRAPSELRPVHDAAARLLAGASGPLAKTILLLALARSGSDGAERRAAMAELASSVPDAPERDPSRFRAEEGRLFRAAALEAPFPARIARARAILVLHGDEAAALVLRGAGARSGEDALAAAEILLATGHRREAERELGPLDRSKTAGIADDARALATAASLQRLARGERSEAGKKPRGGSRTSRAARTAPPPKPPPGELDPLVRQAETHLSGDLRPSVRQRLLTEMLRAGRRADRADVVRAAARRLVELDPAGSAGSEELFQTAFSSFRAAEPDAAGAAAREFSEISSLYRNVSVRRRAVYWEARALQKRGDPSARSLFALLLPGTSPDVYGRWSADMLGVELSAALPPAAAEAPAPESGPASASREYLAAGLDGLAELAAESEGSLDRLFSARIASERGDFRRAASILKALYPALGTPEEGGVPSEVRELFYPLAHVGLLKEEARRANLSPALLCGLIRQESLFHSRVVSRSGAVGLMQVMPATGRLVHRGEGGRGRPDLRLPEENVRLGTRFFRQLLDSFEGDVAAALVAYNAGPSRAARWKRENAALPPDEWVEAIPFTETRDYVKRVLFFSGAYAALYDLPDPPGPPRLTSVDWGAIRPAGVPIGPSRPSGGR